MTEPAHEVIQINYEAAKRGVLPMWTIFDRPKDYPEGFIARRFEGKTPTVDVLTGALDEIRKVLWQAGLLKLSRSPGDEAQIVETWL